MKIGYARSSNQAAIERQEERLILAGCEKVICDCGSSNTEVWKNLDACLMSLQMGDVLMVCSPDQLTRKIADFQQIQSLIEQAGASLVILADPEKLV